MNFEQARFNMVEQQIRPWDVLDTSILDLLFHVKREDFVPVEKRLLAFVDTQLPLDSLKSSATRPLKTTPLSGCSASTR